MANENLPSNLTSKMQLGAILNTLNPFSRIFSSDTREYVPKFLINLFRANKQTPYGQAARAAHVFSKAVGGVGATAGLLALLRLGAHATDMDRINIAGHTPAQKLQKQYQKPTASLLMASDVPQEDIQQQVVQKKASVQKKADAYNVLNATLPPSLALLAAMTAYTMADKYADARQEKRLNQDIATQLKDINQIGTANIQMARGAKKPSKKTMQKKANLSGSLAFLAMLLAAGSGVIGFQAQRAYDPNYIKYKARKKGIQEYNKARVAQTPFISQSIDPAILAKLDPKEQSKKSAPQIDQISVYKPVDIV